ncbi:uncharacterized protein K460DRAFT_349945 [Cucurbitaria berberidis CBS 394.84]|uniref:Uncharacterized protein n=1 Tax=Cucurbitaria berberidis CBS 394.84 TaxID=1168544 RepID=A0A9P4GNL5_9PLEO|nr:uncharacterized protein K460DRAFT_349945 [Cucurbitaria berberidis CBS 394.84]KAF1849793.1 hypothetical protein K460DRAFT_349945 [Cucurbitaria berberidis CBS 394.84]
MPSFEALPTELKVQILEDVYRTGTMRDFTNAMRVNKEWNALGTPLLWTYVAINNQSSLPFIRSLKAARRSTGELVRNLSVLISPIPPGALFPGNIYLVIVSEQLASLIEAKLGGLTTFSYQIAPSVAYSLRWNPTDIRYDSRKADIQVIPLELVATLLDSLPSSCSELELRTWGHDFKGSADWDLDQPKGSNSMCKALDRLLPRLTHLHLEGQNISPFVFESLVRGPTLPLLESLCLGTAKMIVADQDLVQYANLGPQYAPEVVDNQPPLARSVLKQLRLQNIIARELRSSYESGRFPSIKDLQLQQHGMNPRDKMWRLNVVDILEKRIEVTPTAAIRLHFSSRYGTGSEVDHDSPLILIMGRDGELILETEDEFCSRKSNSWVSSTTGTRIPAGRKVMGDITKHGFQWIDMLKICKNRKRFIEWMKSEDSEIAKTFDDSLDVLARALGVPYVIKGLLEWYD